MLRATRNTRVGAVSRGAAAAVDMADPGPPPSLAFVKTERRRLAAEVARVCLDRWEEARARQADFEARRAGDDDLYPSWDLLFNITEEEEVRAVRAILIHAHLGANRIDWECEHRRWPDTAVRHRGRVYFVEFNREVYEDEEPDKYGRYKHKVMDIRVAGPDSVWDLEAQAEEVAA